MTLKDGTCAWQGGVLGVVNITGCGGAQTIWDADTAGDRADSIRFTERWKIASNFFILSSSSQQQWAPRS